MEEKQIEKLPEPEHHLLLPKVHVHFFWQVVLLVVGILALVSGFIFYVIGLNGGTAFGLPFDTASEASQLLFYLGVSILMAAGLTCIILWALWKFAGRYRVRFIISLSISTIAIVSGLISVASKQDPAAQEYAFYFFALTLGLLIGLSSLYFFFIGVSRHVFGTHRYEIRHKEVS